MQKAGICIRFRGSALPIDAAPALRQAGAVKSILTLLLLLAAVLPSGAGERVVLYVTLLENTTTELSDGAKWQMDKGDCFPVVSYKESHTMVILQLASAKFMIPAVKTRVVSEKELPVAIANYRANVSTYINGVAARWRAAAESGKAPQ